MTEKEMELHYQNLEKELAEYDSRVSEMAKEISKSNILCKNCGDYGDTYCTEAIANTLYKAGYRKLPEGSVVLTKEEYDEDYVTKQDRDYWKNKTEILGNKLKQTRKETAKEILSDAEKELHKVAMEYANAGHKTYFAVCENIYHKVIRPLAKQYGVEEWKK